MGHLDGLAQAHLPLQLHEEGVHGVPGARPQGDEPGSALLAVADAVGWIADGPARAVLERRVARGTVRVPDEETVVVSPAGGERGGQGVRHRRRALLESPPAVGITAGDHRPYGPFARDDQDLCGDLRVVAVDVRVDGLLRRPLEPLVDGRREVAFPGRFHAASIPRRRETSSIVQSPRHIGQMAA
ncbi:hypothetical protein [Microbispora hainanensis]|uniref:Uncharacterized protein n=1 Tax=Microbispora hainanensis TaxID=568844 RepID=A0ABZ1SI75_9ACTN|nr:hypothetical protein [Microbispora hainanensis]